MMKLSELGFNCTQVTNLSFSLQKNRHLQHIGLEIGSEIRRLPVRTAASYDLFLVDGILEIALRRGEQQAIEVAEK